MVAIQVRDVSDQSRDALAAEAERRGLSLQMFLHDVLEREAASARNIAWVRSKSGMAPMFTGGPTTRELIDAANEERTRQVLDVHSQHA